MSDGRMRMYESDKCMVYSATRYCPPLPCSPFFTLHVLPDYYSLVSKAVSVVGVT